MNIQAQNPTTPWNKGKLCGQKAPLKPREIWAIRTRLQLAGKTRDFALFNLAIDSKLRGCDLVALRLRDVAHGDVVQPRAVVLQQKTQRPVQFEITQQTRQTLTAWVRKARLGRGDYLFKGRSNPERHLSTRQYARLIKRWTAQIGLDTTAYGTHSLRRTKPTIIYRQTKNLRAVQLLLGHTKLESTVRYIGVEVEDALTISERIEI